MRVLLLLFYDTLVYFLSEVFATHRLFKGISFIALVHASNFDTNNFRPTFRRCKSQRRACDRRNAIEGSLSTRSSQTMQHARDACDVASVFSSGCINIYGTAERTKDALPRFRLPVYRRNHLLARRRRATDRMMLFLRF